MSPRMIRDGSAGLPGNPNDWLSSQEVAEVLEVGYRKALELIGAEIPAHYNGYRYKTRRRDVWAYIDRHMVVGKKKRRGRGRRAA